ncbi:MAG: hypothetical protein GF364_22140 [Candidatus Lokiarchaeota archaeon]|nr:hypothetical protein [Candidatus Lokiarchaeota archaeon]
MMSNSANKKKNSLRKTNPTLCQILDEIGGPVCIKVAEQLYNIDEDEITDDNLSEICDIKLNIVRKILYILYDNKLSEFRKVRDKKSGWFIYYWHDTYENVKDLIKLKHEKVVEKLIQRLQYEETNQFYKCTNPDEIEPDSDMAKELGQKRKERQKKIKAREKSSDDKEKDPIPEIKKPDCNFITTFNEAVDIDFKCPRCGGALTHYDNTEIQKFLREKIAVLRQNIKFLS